MFRFVSVASVSLVSLLMFASCHQDRMAEEELLAVLDSLEHKLEWLHYRVELENWTHRTTGEADSLEFYRDLYDYVISGASLLSSLKDRRHLLSGETDKRRWDIIHSTALAASIESDRRIAPLRDSLSRITMTYRAEYDGERRTNDYLYRTYRSNGNRVRREEAYRACCSVGDKLADGLGRLFRLRNQLARRAGYNNFMALTFNLKDVSPDYYRSLLRQFDAASEEPYQRILEQARTRLKTSELEIWDLAFAYADVNREVDSYLPADSQMKFIRRSLRAIGFDLDRLPIYFDLTSVAGTSQYVHAYAVTSPNDVRIVANFSSGIRSTRMLFHEIGRALHSAHVAQQRPLFANAIDGCWEEGMARVFAALADDPAWLEQYANLPPRLIARHIEAKCEQDVIDLRMMLLWLDFEYEAYSNPNRDLNKLFWDLFVKYLRLPRHDEIKPWAAMTHFATDPEHLQNRLYADVIAAQTLGFIRRNYGCLVDNQTTRSFLVQNYFRFGGRYDWRELLKRGTDEELNPDYLTEELGI